MNAYIHIYIYRYIPIYIYRYIPTYFYRGKRRKKEEKEDGNLKATEEGR